MWQAGGGETWQAGGGGEENGSPPPRTYILRLYYEPLHNKQLTILLHSSCISATPLTLALLTHCATDHLVLSTPQHGEHNSPPAISLRKKAPGPSLPSHHLPILFMQHCLFTPVIVIFCWISCSILLLIPGGRRREEIQRRRQAADVSSGK